MTRPRGFAYRVAYVPWYRPIKLFRRIEGGGFEQIGWTWRTKAYQVNNVNYGWIAFLEDQTKEKLSQCPWCKQTMPVEEKK